MTLSFDLGVRPDLVWALLERNGCRCGKFADDGCAVRFRATLLHGFDLLLGNLKLQELLGTETDAVAVCIVSIGTLDFRTLAVDFRSFALVFSLRTLLLRGRFCQGLEHFFGWRCLANDDFHDFCVDVLGFHELPHLAENDTLDFSENVFPFAVELASRERCHRGLRDFITNRGAEQLFDVLLVPIRTKQRVQLRGFAGNRPNLDVCIEVDRDVVDSDGAVPYIIEAFRELNRADVIHDDVRRVEQPLGAGDMRFRANPAIAENGEERLVDEDGFIPGLDLHSLRDQNHDGDEKDEGDRTDDALFVAGPEVGLIFTAVVHVASFQWVVGLT